MPAAMTDEIQAFPIPQKPKQLQKFVVLLGYWQVFIPYLAQPVHPFYRLTHKGAAWDWGEEAFKAAKQVVKTVQALGVIDQSYVCDLYIHITPEGYTWVLWQ